MYAIGEGVSQDFAAALPWFRKAAEQGNAGAQLGLGLMYDNGHGVRQDYVQAHMWFNLSGAQGDADAIKKRDAVAAKMTPAQIAEAQKLAREWKP
jgi:TPR repeat protein